MADNDGELADYKIHSFDGTPKIILVCKDRFRKSGLTEDFFDVNWNHLNMKRPSYRNSCKSIPRPDCLEEMLELSRVLSAGIPFVK